MFNFNKLALVLTFASSLQLVAAVPTGSIAEDGNPIEDNALQAVVPTAPAGPSTGFTGLIEIRPSFTTEGNEYHTENTIELGYRFSPKFKLAFNQAFNTNISNPAHPDMGLNPEPIQGFLSASFSNLWESGSWSLAYQPRLYVPETKNDFDTQRVASLRNYIMLTKSFGSTYSLTFMEIPILHAYGARSFNGKPNQYYENRFYIMNDFTFGKLSVSFPILLISQSKLDMPGGNSRWQHALWFWPEVTYAIQDNVNVGVALYTESIISPDFSSLTLTDKGAGLNHSVAQFVLRATL